MRNKKNKTMGLSLTGVGLLFFFNPQIAVIDIFPDFIGCLLIIAGIRALADLDPHMGDVRERFVRLLWVTLAKPAALLLVYSMPVSELPTMRLVMTFAFAVAELIYLIPALRMMSEAMLYLGERYGGESPYYIRPRREKPERPSSEKKRRARRPRPVKTATERLFSFAVVFVIIRNALAVLPELCSLSSYDNLGYVTNNSRDIADFYGLILVICVMAALVPGIIYFVRCAGYFRRIRRDTVFTDNLRRDYDVRVAVQDSLFTRRGISLALTMLMTGIALNVDLYISDLDAIPDILSALFIILGLIMLRKYSTRTLPAMIAAVIYAAATGIASAFAVSFNLSTYTLHSVTRDYAAHTAYMRVCYATVAEMLAGTLMLAALFICLCDIIRNHTGRLSVSGESVERRDVAEGRRALTAVLCVGMVLGVLAFVMTVVYDYNIVNVDYYAVGDGSYKYEFDFSQIVGVLSFVASATFAVIGGKALADIKEKVNDRYML